MFLRTCTKNKRTRLSLSLLRHVWARFPSLWMNSFWCRIRRLSQTTGRAAMLSLRFPLHLSDLKTTRLLIPQFFFVFRVVFVFFCLVYSGLWHFLRWSGVRLETHKLFGHLVVGPLREYPHDGEARFVHGDALYQRVAGRAAALLRQLPERDDRHADDAVLAGKAVILHRDVELVDLRTVFVTQNTERDEQIIEGFSQSVG